jgi:hypothetical protein
VLKLTAFDADDLAVLSAQMQDAIIRAGDIKYLKRAGKLAILANRFAWDEVGGGSGRRLHRRRTGLHFARVRDVRAHHIRQDNPEAILSLLAISFAPDEEPSGRIRLDFSGGGRIETTVECIEAALEDLGPSWETAHMPSHERG